MRLARSNFATMCRLKKGLKWKGAWSIPFWYILFVFLLTIGITLAQDSRISGTVTDATGGVIPGVEVKVTHLDTGVVRTAITDDAGHYSVPQLFAGNYSVTATMTGFESQRLELLLDPAQTTEQNLSLVVGAPSTVIEVASTSARINVNPYDVATTIEEKQIEQLPLNGRNYLALAQLSPGILRGNQGTRGDRPINRRAGLKAPFPRSSCGPAPQS